MNEWRPTPETGARHHSRNVALVFLGAVTVVGGLVAWEAYQRARMANTPPPWPQPAVPPVSADRIYANNEFVPGLGYYHAPYHAWFPYMFNFYDPARGYYAGGLWQAAPFLANMLSSRPSNAAVASAGETQRLRDEQQRQQRSQAGSTSGSGFFRGSSFSGSGFSTSGGGESASGGGASISRGGFGGSAHGGGAGE